MNRAVKIGIAGTSTALLVLGGIGTYNLLHGLTGGTAGDRTQDTGFDPSAASTTPPSGTEAVKSARAFLDHWSGQNVGGAAAGTDEPDAAAVALRPGGVADEWFMAGMTAPVRVNV